MVTERMGVCGILGFNRLDFALLQPRALPFAPLMQAAAPRLGRIVRGRYMPRIIAGGCSKAFIDKLYFARHQ